MQRLKSFLKNEAVLIISALLTLISMVIVSPCAAYAGYIDYSVIALLFCLMAVVAGLQKSGVFELVSYSLLKKAGSTRAIAVLLTLFSFFLAMLVTNDVALITLVPLTVMVLFDRPRALIITTVLITAAANLGSMATPIGNPQNLYLYSHYSLSIGQFMGYILPLCGVCLAVMAVLPFIAVKKENIQPPQSARPNVSISLLVKYSLLFTVCILSVLGVVHYLVCTAVTVLVLLFTDRGVFKQIDYFLLLTFICFFVFVGNVSSIEPVRAFISSALRGRELIVSALVSQVISNVPAAVMLSSFTDNARALLLGVNIGGLGTPVASLASLISYKLYCRSAGAKRGRYLLVFCVANFSLLILLLAVALLLYQS